MSDAPLRWHCTGCGAPFPDDEVPLRCRSATDGDGIDHLLARVATLPAPLQFGDEANPFLRYRRQLSAYEVARAGGLSDSDFCALVNRLDDAVAAVDGAGFRVTPCTRSAALEARLGLGALWIKDETNNVSGSHKGRHLMGLLLELEVRAALGRATDGPLAIASCGNAALAAAVMARAAGRRLAVFIPPDAGAAVVDRLVALGARLTVCPREEGIAGDPCYRRFRLAVEEGALPFACQGPDAGLTIDGGRTIGYELVETLGAHGGRFDRLFVQVGGGALASALVQSLDEAVTAGALVRLPRIHAVQTEGAHPLRRAYQRVAERLSNRLNLTVGGVGGTEAIAALHPQEIVKELRLAARDRASFMWPWESEPRSVAHGILDDETYDWRAIVSGMLRSGGTPIVVSESLLEEANRAGRDATGSDVDHTGTAGLAGLLAHERRPGESVAVIFSGHRRGA